MTTHPSFSTERLDVVDEADVAALTRLLESLVRDDAALGWTDPPDRAEVRGLLDALVAAAPDDACLTVGRNTHGTVVGFGYWRRYDRPTHAPHADLEKLAVATESAGQGLGRRLLRELIGAARDAGIEQLTIDFRGDSFGAERLYLSEGFVEYGRLRDFVAPDATRRLDKVLQVLDLRGQQ